MGEIADDHQSYIAEEIAEQSRWGFSAVPWIRRKTSGVIEDKESPAGIEVHGVDPRATCQFKLIPSFPLPFLSRRSLKRVKHRIDPPKQCVCGSPAVDLVSNARVYAGREYGEWPYIYLCAECGAYVGVHKGTDLPLGTLADKETREARKAAKEPFMRLVRQRFGSDRSAAYAWLAGRMGIGTRYCHFGMFTEQQCNEVLRIINHTNTGRGY